MFYNFSFLYVQKKSNLEILLSVITEYTHICRVTIIIEIIQKWLFKLHNSYVMKSYCRIMQVLETSTPHVKRLLPLQFLEGTMRQCYSHYKFRICSLQINKDILTLQSLGLSLLCSFFLPSSFHFSFDLKHCYQKLAIWLIYGSRWPV